MAYNAQKTDDVLILAQYDSVGTLVEITTSVGNEAVCGVINADAQLIKTDGNTFLCYKWSCKNLCPYTAPIEISQ